LLKKIKECIKTEKIMNEIVVMVLTFITGLALGMLFFGGLWLTVKKLFTSKTPALLFLGSFIFRTGVTLVGFYYIVQGSWQRLVICLVGFVIARYIVTRFTKPNDKKELLIKERVNL